MKIHFCDLCNESVPQADLDEGRAFMRKGRVVCGKCDQLMTQRENMPAAAASVQGPFGASSPPIPEPQASVTPLPVAPGGSDFGQGSFSAPAHTHHHAPNHSHVNHGRGQRSGSGVAVALFALALTALGLYWLTERADKDRRQVDDKFAAAAKVQLDAEMREMTRSTELQGQILKLEEKLKESTENERKAFDARIVDGQSKLDKALLPLGELRNDIASLKSVVPSTQRHDQELLASAQKVADLENRAVNLESAILEMKKQLDAKPAAGPASPVAPATPVGTPPWMGLVQQLESPASGDRWVAVSSLGETKDPAVAEYLLPRLKDVDIFVRMATARVLGDLGSPKAIGALIETLNDQDSSVREAAYVSLCTVSKKSLPFDPHQDTAERAKRVKAWQDWWKKAQEDGAAQ
ncbi:MAG TPA: HEAT repeat domain-containing protein [Planctomycetota bacterium]|nr:HEAT repeat domain-containing protein [Planctomycetota bacterium]